MPTLNDVARAMQNAQELGDSARYARLMEVYNREYSRLYPTPKREKEESGFLENIATGFGAGYVGTLESAALGAATLQEEEAELKSRQKIKSVADRFTPEGGDKDSISYKLASGIGSIGAFATAAPLGKAALPIAGALGVASGAGEASERARAYGATEEERNIAVRKGAAIGATEVLPLGLLAKSLKIPGLPKAIDKISSKVSPATVTGIKSRLQRAAATGVKEGAQEAAAAVLQNLTEQGYNPEQVLFEAGVLEEGSIGGGAGAILQGLVDLFGKKRIRSVKDDEGTAEETTEEATEETPVSAETTATEETPKPKVVTRKKGTTLKSMVESTLADMGMPQLEATLANAGRDAKNAGLPVGTYALMVKSAIKKKKEPTDVGEQATRTPDAETTGDSVPSSPEVVGEQRADSAVEPARPVEGRLDDSKRDTGRPARGKGRKQSTLDPLAKLGLKPGQKINLAELQKKETTAPEPTTSKPEDQKGRAFASVTDLRKTKKARDAELQRIERSKPEDETPTIEKGKIKYPKAASFIKPYANQNKDNTTLDSMYNMPEVKEVNKKTNNRAERRKLKKQNTVIKYLQKFDSPYSAIMNAANDVAGETIKDADGPLDVLLQSPKAKDKRAQDPNFAVMDDILKSTGGANAKEVIRWMNAKSTGLSADFKKQVNGFILEKREELRKSVAKAEVASRTEVADDLNKLPLKDLRTKLVKLATNANEVGMKLGEYKSLVETTIATKEKAADTKAATEAKKVEKEKAAEAEAKKDKDVASATKDDAETKVDPIQLRNDGLYNDFVSRPTTDLTKASDLQKAEEYADRGTDPEGTRADLKERIKQQQVSGVVTAGARKRLAKKKEEQGQKKKTEPTKKKTTIDTALERLNDERVTKAGLELMRKDLGMKYLKKATLEEAIDYSKSAAIAQEQGYTGSLYTSDAKAVKAISKNVSAKTKKLLEQGDLKGALLEIAKTVENRKMKTIARGLAANIGTTSVSFDTDAGIKGRMPPQYASDNTITYGVFFHGSNSIVLNKNVPTSIHLVMHEATHATVDISYHRNKNSVPAKQLKKLFDELKPFLDPNAEGQNIREFIAESQSNPIFRRRLGQIKDAEGISAWQKLVNIFKNFLNIITGFGTVPVNSKLTVVDDAVMLLMNPTPENFTNSYNLDPSQMAKGVNEALAPVREQAAENAKGFKNWWKDLTLGEKGLKGLAMGIHLQTLGDIARATGFGNLVAKLNELVENQTGRIIEAQDVIRDAEKAHKKFAQQVGTEALNTYNRIIYNEQYGATIYDVDPFAPKLQYQGKYDNDGNDLFDIHDLQREQLEDIRKNKPAVYKAMEKHYNAQKKLYKDQFAAVLRAIKLESKNLLDSGDVDAQKRLDELTAQLMKRATIEEYFPLVREGDFSVAYVYEIKDDKGNFLRSEAGYEMFEHLAERDEYIKLLKETDGVKDIKPYNKGMTKAFFDNAPNGTYVSEVLKTLKGAGVGRDVQEDIIKQFVSTLPATSVYRSLVKRGNVPGYIQDAGVALETKGRSLAAQAAKIESAAELRAIARQIEERADELNNPKATAIADVAINKHIKFAIRGADNKGKEMIYKEFNQVAFLYTLGFNVSSAIVNLSQIPLFAVPYLGARYGVNNTIDAFTQASSVISGAKISIIEYYDKDFNLKASVKKDIEENAIDKADAKARIEYLESIIPIVREARKRGKLYSGDTLIELGVNEKANARDKLAHWSAFFFNGAERFNTQTTIVATYDLVRQQMSDKAKAGEKFFSVREGKEITVPTDIGQRRELAAKEAMYQAQEVNGGARLETTAPIAKQGIGRVALMYKSYGLAMNTAMIKSGLAAGDKLYEGNSEEKKIAIKQLAGIHLSSLLFAGLGGVPLWGLVSMVWDLFLDDEEDDADTILRKYVQEMGFKGPLSTLTGVDVSARIKLNDLIFQENRFMRDPSLEESIGYYIGGPALSTAKRFYRSWNDFAEGEYWRGTEAALPAGFGNAMTAGRYFKDNGIKTRGGQFIYEDIGAGEIATKVFGFAPLEYTFRTEQSAAEQKISNAVMERRSKLTKRYFRAIMQRDTSEARDVLADIREFNRRHPTAGISDATIKRSVKSQMDKVATMHNGVPVNKMMQYALEKKRREYKQWD